MTEDVIEHYDTLNTKRCPDKQFFGGFNHKPIPPNYYIFPNDDDDDIKNIFGTPVEYALPENKILEDAGVSNDTDINDEIIIDGDDYYKEFIYIDIGGKKCIYTESKKASMAL